MKFNTSVGGYTAFHDSCAGNDIESLIQESLRLWPSPRFTPFTPSPTRVRGEAERQRGGVRACAPSVIIPSQALPIAFSLAFGPQSEFPYGLFVLALAQCVRPGIPALLDCGSTILGTAVRARVVGQLSLTMHDGPRSHGIEEGRREHP